MKLLAIDTSTEACSAALFSDGEIKELWELAPRRHAELVLSMIDTLCADAGIGVANLDGLAFGRGPGAFTGLRIGAGVIQGIAFGLDLSVVPVSSLAALAQGALREAKRERVLSAIDARIGEVYWGAYACGENRIMRGVLDECIRLPSEVPIPEHGPWFGVGSGWQAHGAALAARLGESLSAFEAARYPRAQDVAVLGVEGFLRGESVPAESALPVYLRDQVVR
ncbi:MAG: tRNA (adenosine(37)-N6)-threonylcarbamoyltransferase complex dimerization subunit type 1 TsaB [Gammaproteobacteria bacterium]